MPAAGMVWPIIDFTDPMTAWRPGPNTARSVASSAASPAGVAVPCASTSPTESGAAGSSPAAAHAQRTARTWPALAGCIRLTPPPSLATPVPRITA